MQYRKSCSRGIKNLTQLNACDKIFVVLSLYQAGIIADLFFHFTVIRLFPLIFSLSFKA